VRHIPDDGRRHIECGQCRWMSWQDLFARA
jgi:hypothetical protein